METKPKKTKNLKVGILYFLDAKRKNPVRRFCILTANKEIDYYSKDEYDPAAKVGSISDLEHCKVSVIESTQADFVVVTQDQTFNLQAQGGDQDRRNWVLEILKQRPIRSIIELLEDEKLTSYAAYALANLSGAADSVKAEVVAEGGLGPLLRVAKNSGDTGLSGLIYYSLSKLSLLEQNRQAIGVHLPLLVDLLRGDNPEWKGHSIKTLANLISVPSLREQIYKIAFRPVMRALETAHPSLHVEASTILCSFIDGTEYAERAQSELAADVKVFSDWLSTWLGLKERDDRLRNHVVALANILKLLVTCFKTRRLEGRVLLRTVCALTYIRKPEVQGPLLDFVTLYVEAPPPNSGAPSTTPPPSVDADHNKGSGGSIASSSSSPRAPVHTLPQEAFDSLGKLLECLDSEDRTVRSKCTVLLAHAVKDDRFKGLDDVLDRLNAVAIVDQLGSEDADVRSASAELFAVLALKPGAAARLQRDASSFTKLGDAMLKDMSLSRKLTASLASLSTVPEIKYALVTGSLRQGLLASLSATRDGAEVTEQVLEVFANCTSNAGARRALADPAVLKLLIDMLKSPSQDVQMRVGSVLSNLSTNSLIRRELREMEALTPIFGSVMATKNRHLRMELMGAIRNICFSGSGVGVTLPEDHLAYMISVIGSKSIKLRVAAVLVLRNACLSVANRETIIRLGGVPPLFGFLPSVKPEVQHPILMTLAACLEQNCRALQPAMLQALFPCWNHTETRRAVLRCIAAAACNPEAHTVVLSESTRLFEIAEGSDYVSAEYAALSLQRCIEGTEGLARLTASHVEQFLRLCSSTNPVVVSRSLSALASIEAAHAGSLNEATKLKLSAFLDFPVSSVRTACVRILGQDPHVPSGLESVSANAGMLLELLGRGASLLSSWQWSVKVVGPSEAAIVCTELPIHFGSELERSVFLAKLKLGNTRVRLHLSGRSFGDQDAPTRVSAPSLEQLHALVEYWRVVSPLARGRARDVDAVMEDVITASLTAPLSDLSGARRSWGTCSEMLKVSTVDGVVTYVAQHIGGPAAVIAGGNAPYLGEFSYFEVLILADAGTQGGICVGICGVEKFLKFRMPGWGDESFGYHGDDGNFYWGSSNRPFGPRFGAGDVVGCGIDEIKGDLFFTLNGKFLGVAASGCVNSFRSRPCVGLSCSGESVFANFGKSPFLWDFTFIAPSFPSVVAPRAQDLPVVHQSDPTPKLNLVTPMNFGGGLWAAEFSKLYDRLCFLDPVVDNAVTQTREILSKESLSK